MNAQPVTSDSPICAATNTRPIPKRENSHEPIAAIGTPAVL